MIALLFVHSFFDNQASSRAVALPVVVNGLAAIASRVS